jgi:hypothetical protein
MSDETAPVELQPKIDRPRLNLPDRLKHLQ